MLSLISIVFTFLALILIPAGLFVSRRLRVPLSWTNIIRYFRITASTYDDEKRPDLIGEQEKRMRNNLPKHVAIILDGNRRWAEKRGLGASEGHEAGVKSLMENTKHCLDLGINTISLFAFSTENWQRPEDEVNFLWTLFEKHLKTDIPSFQRENIKISVIGYRTRIPKSLLSLIQEAEEATKNFQGRHLIVALDYSGRFDILQACKSLATKARDGMIQVEDIDEKAMDNELMTKCSEFPNPDMLIRTSGEQRLSNFFLWQSAYTELYFPQVLWPDFGKADYLEALNWYQQRQRRFGRRV